MARDPELEAALEGRAAEAGERPVRAAGDLVEGDRAEAAELEGQVAVEVAVDLEEAGAGSGALEEEGLAAADGAAAADRVGAAARAGRKCDRACGPRRQPQVCP
ncbi:MAG TPA: hypothetical protein VLW54_01650 [Candidatus Acidoferrales bacterium]|nr:hypothetical protein [Candidatus Acidoferrales bacterium]